MDWMCEQEQEQCVLVDLLLWQEDDFAKETDRVILGMNGWMNVINAKETDRVISGMNGWMNVINV